MSKKESVQSLERNLQRINEAGYLVLEEAIADDLAWDVSRELEPHFDATPRCVGDFYGWKTTRVAGVLAKAPLSQSLVLHAGVLALVNALLSPSCDCVQLNLTQAVRVHPGERAQAPHRDEEMWPQPQKQAPWLVNVMWALSDFTKENGATRLWPGSHIDRLGRDADPRASIAAEMRPGSALVFLGALTHGAGANVSEEPRSGLIVSYCLGWLKQYENQFLTYAPEVVRSFPEPLQRLIGYQMHRPNLGGWEGQDPSAFLDAERTPKPHVDALTPAIAVELKAHYGG